MKKYEITGVCLDPNGGLKIEDGKAVIRMIEVDEPRAEPVDTIDQIVIGEQQKRIAELEASEKYEREQKERILDDWNRLKDGYDEKCERNRELHDKISDLEGHLLFSRDCCGNAVDSYLDKKNLIEQLEFDRNLWRTEAEGRRKERDAAVKERDRYVVIAQDWSDRHTELQARIDNVILKLTKKEHCLYGCWPEPIIDILTGKDAS
jgi:hypothetical protein